MKKGWLLVFLFLLLMPFSYALTNVGSCRTIGDSESDNSYVLNTSLVSSNGSTCITITRSHTIFDLSGFSISNSTVSSPIGAAVYVNNVANVTMMNGRFNNSFYGIYFDNVSSSNITNITTVNIDQYGLFLQSSNNNTMNNNSILHVSSVEIYVYLSNYWNLTSNNCYNATTCYRVFGNYTNLTDNMANTSSYGYLSDATSYNNYLYNNTAVNTTNVGIELFSNYNFRVYSNNVSVNTAAAYVFATTINASIENNTAFYSTTWGFYFTTGENNSIVNNTINADNLHAIGITTGTNNSNFTRNRIFGATDGILLDVSYKNNFTDNIINEGNSGVALDNANVGLHTGSGNNTFTNNTVHGTTNGFYVLDFSSDNNFTNNTVYNNSNYGFIITGNSNGNILTSNHAFNNSYYGFYMNDSRNNILISNNATNNSLGGIFFLRSNGTLNGSFLSNNSNFQIGVDNSTINISGLINISHTLVNQLDFNISNGGVVNDLGLVNILTMAGSYIINNATNISIKAVTRSDAGVTEVGCVSAGFSSCTLLTNNSMVLNITNTSAVAGLNLTMWYDVARANSLGASYTELRIARYSAGWNDVGRTASDASQGRVVYTPITSFATLNFNRIGIGCLVFKDQTKMQTLITKILFNPYINFFMFPSIFRMDGNCGWNPMPPSSISPVLGRITYDNVNSFSIFGVVRFVAVDGESSSDTSSSSNSGGSVSGGGAITGSPSQSLTILSDLGSGKLELKDTQQDQVANNFVFGVTCITSPCNVYGEEIAISLLPAGASSPTEEVLGLTQLDCTGELWQTTKDFGIRFF